MRVFLDTNVFLYAAGGPHRERDACVNLLQRLADGSLEATANTEVVQEILFVLTRRGRRHDAVTLALSVVSLFPDLLPVTRDDMEEACRLVERYPKLPARDAVHVATMLNNGLTTVISVDADFDQISSIRRLAPRAA